LIEHPQIVLLKKRYNEIIKNKPIDPERESDAFSGTGLHRLFWEYLKNNIEYIAEERITTRICNRIISGEPDIFHVPTETLYDLKHTKAYTKVFSDMFKWEQQLNMYALLFKLVKNIDVKKLIIIGWWRDFDKRLCKDNIKYPRQKIEEIELNLWDYEEQVDFVNFRVSMMKSLESVPDHKLPECSASDRWERPESWTIYRLYPNGKKYKKASRVLSSEFEACKWAITNMVKKKYKIEHRIGSRERCENWCEVSDYCHQYQEYKNGKK